MRRAVAFVVIAGCAAPSAPNVTATVTATVTAPVTATVTVTAPVTVTVTATATVSTPQVPDPPPGMLLVPAGTFTMGSDTGGEDDEHPAHPVTLRAFFLDQTEVTTEAYDACVAAKHCRPPATRVPLAPRLPVRFVGWDDAKTFCESHGKRLPREAEFERAVRGDDGRRFPWGNEPPTPERAVFLRGAPMDVGSRPAGRGPYGHDDLAGNVWEWIEDEYDPFAYTRPTAAEGKPGSCAEILAAQDKLRAEHRQGFTGTNAIPVDCEHAIRGGAYNYGAEGLRATNRVHHAKGFRITVLGFRCAKDVTLPEP